MDSFTLWLEKQGVKKVPPKKWWDRCVKAVGPDSDDPNRLCGWIWHHHMSEKSKRKAIQK